MQIRAGLLLGNVLISVTAKYRSPCARRMVPRARAYALYKPQQLNNTLRHSGGEQMVSAAPSLQEPGGGAGALHKQEASESQRH